MIVPLIVHVKHFLDANGIKFFPRWFEKAVKLLLEREGFLSIGYAYDSNEEGCVNLWLEFECLEKLKKWGTSKLHDDLVNELNPYRVKPYVATRYQLEQKICMK